MKCIIAIEDPTDYIDDPTVDWSRTGGDPRVFLESKKVWEKTIATLDTDFTVLFCKTDAILPKGECRIDGNALWLPGRRADSELLAFGMNIFTYVEQNFEYDFLMTTTLGSFWVFPRLKKVLEDLPKTGIYTGRKWDAGSLSWPPWAFISGSGIVYSRDVIRTMINHRHVLESDPCPCDDAKIGLFIAHCGVDVRRQDWWMDLDQNTLEDLDGRIRESDSRGIVQYRVKNCANRLYFDPIILNRLYDWYSRA
jgi:hypothetical protein